MLKCTRCMIAKFTIIEVKKSSGTKQFNQHLFLFFEVMEFQMLLDTVDIISIKFQKKE